MNGARAVIARAGGATLVPGCHDRNIPARPPPPRWIRRRRVGCFRSCVAPSRARRMSAMPPGLPTTRLILTDRSPHCLAEGCPARCQVRFATGGRTASDDSRMCSRREGRFIHPRVRYPFQAPIGVRTLSLRVAPCSGSRSTLPCSVPPSHWPRLKEVPPRGWNDQGPVHLPRARRGSRLARPILTLLDHWVQGPFRGWPPTLARDTLTPVFR